MKCEYRVKCYIMNGASDENTENRIGDENDENEQFLRQKGQRKRRSHALAYRDTNISGSERCQEPPTRNRWLPTGTSAFTIFCDDENDQGSSKDFKENYRQQEEGNKRSGEISMQALEVPRKIRRPLATLSPNREDSDSENSISSLANLPPLLEESNSEDNVLSGTDLETNENEDDNSRNSIASSANNRDIFNSESHSDDEIAFNVDSVDIQEIPKNVPNISSQEATASGSMMYTIEEHQDRVRMDPIYDSDIYAYMRYRELELYPFGDFLEFQEEICGEVRYILVEWICDSAREFNLSTESLHMAVSIVDRVLNTIQCPRQNLQLLGAVALLLASKFEEIYPPEVKEFARITAYTFHETEILRMERIVFARVEYQLLAPTSWWFASRLIRMARVPRIIYYMIRYLLELALLDHAFLDFRPSVIGAASFFLSNVIFKSDYLLSITETDIGLDELRSPARKMLELFHEVPNKNYCSVFEKYAAEKYEQVSCLILPDNFSELDIVP
ncbi:unnamed protein product [Onchocerca ochengi]|uniref:Cyclin N-terminal domain-containing protein n=1 Tax=Onchocerca ochengi TaxID=42157 RepID=A0A182E2E7_ONCOC|nr:unnamed protein product [Onchocerca ochengi]